ncbi:hypothetical protein [Arthrobacter sp. CAN_C5]|uniref:hypothetical protein n=1 Tax=Arthrobacter sp. CAN_C5 TaxID=2760706 RepID=UPI001AE9A023|nr:hypothetical protein [Arthrobacter sp. CAN_C5]MBP2216791.1 hypothetical protein [Arthrobacter sp. CAN_C5]
MDQKQIERAADTLGAIIVQIESGDIEATPSQRAYVAGAEHALRLVRASHLETGHSTK